MSLASFYLPLKKTIVSTTKNKEMNENEWPWVLSKIGKKILRPGGRELTMLLLKSLNIQKDDSVVEFAPGIGFTAEQILKLKPKSYTGLELNEEAGQDLKEIVQGANNKIIIGNAMNAGEGLKSGSIDKVIGEAMLTMHSDNRKINIISEANRMLRKGGRYAIHELCLSNENISEEEKKAIQKDLSSHSHVNTRPLTLTEWKKIIEDQGFKVVDVWTRPMLLLEPSRVLKDEGFLNMARTIFNVLRRPQARKKILEMRKLFQKHRDDIKAIGIVAEKL